MNYLQYIIVFNAHAYTIELFSDIFIEPFFQKENRLIKKNNKTYYQI